MDFKIDHRLMQVKSLQNALLEHSAILSTFIKLPFVFKTLNVLAIFEWPLKTGFTYVLWVAQFGPVVPSTDQSCHSNENSRQVRLHNCVGLSNPLLTAAGIPNKYQSVMCW